MSCGDGDQAIDAAIEKRAIQRLHSDKNLATASQMKRTPPQQVTTTTSTPQQSLLAMLTRRLAEAEKELAAKERKHAEMETRLAEADMRNSQLADTNRELELELREIEAFLADYGLVWVGSGSPRRRRRPSTESGRASSTPGRPRPRPPRNLPRLESPPKPPSATPILDMAKIKRNVAELNVLVGEGVAKVAKTRDGSHQLRVQEPLRFTVYQDGIFVLNGPFRPYAQDPTAKRFVEDLGDGYFPSEIQKRFPDGVPLEMEDRSTETFNATSSAPPRSTSVQPPAGTALGPASTGQAKFERALPEVVIRGGVIVPVRGAIRAMLSASLLSPSSSVAVEDVSKEGTQTVSLKVVIRCNAKSIEVRIPANSTLADLRKIVAKHHGPKSHSLTVPSVPPAAVVRVLQPSEDGTMISTLDIDRALIRVACECAKQ
jgi:hypothetical protein